MADTPYNPTFKRPTSARPQYMRSPSPPRAFVEPLSPPKPTPMEPNFNYPPIHNPLRYPASAEQPFAATPRSRAYSTNQQNGHHRTPSSIDTLAEAALGSSPYHGHSRHSSAIYETNGYSHAHPSQHPYGTSEPPHKRTRSELLPSPHVGYQASRPATSYQSHPWSHSAHHGQGYNSRVEEAALLLNFQSGGWPGQSSPSAPKTFTPAAPRPHANSFPQGVLRPRPAEAVRNPQPGLLPSFHPHTAHQQPPIFETPEDTLTVPASPRHTSSNGHVGNDVDMQDAPCSDPVRHVAEQPLGRPADDQMSHGESTDVTVSEASDAPKPRRGWPKGKPRGSGARKTIAEKAATKRAASRKKTPDSKASRGKSDGIRDASATASEPRRKSLNDAFVFGEQDSNEESRSDAHRPRSVPPKTPMIIREAAAPKASRRKLEVRPDTVCAGCQTSRETATSRGEFDEWISCNGCKKWFHIDCAGFKKAHDIRDVDKYFCTACEPEHGKTTYVRKSTRAHASVDYAELQRGVLKTGEEERKHHYIQPIKDGTFQFDREAFPRMRPEMVTREFFERSGTFTEPICVPAAWNPRPWAEREHAQSHPHGTNGEGCNVGALADALIDELEYETVPDHGQDRLEMVMPEGLSVRSVCNLIGGDWPIDVIDVKTQNSGAKWNMAKWADYYEEIPDESKAIRNVISLEVSQTKLGRLLQRPKVVRDLDLQDDVWPQEEIDKGKFPKVQFYCLMSVADSYTDFHIDFGGSSVYYHILKGKKTFFFIPPKAKHLKAYEEWNDSPQQNFTFLPNITKECYRVDLHEGDTMLIPSGWIHAVWTPEDSLVIGGNFLNRLSYKNQFKVVDIEKANETPMKFRYPSFQKVMWYTAIKYLQDDPLPEEVSQLFYDGRRFEREVPVWADFDGEIARNNPQPGWQNARYYSQAEIEGLPELVNYIFRTVMLVMGRIEGVSADRVKRVNASIPKGFGDPLKLAQKFAFWSTWKRGNEDPPTWAHPDAVLPSSKEGPPKKLSERKLKELERKEAIAAWRIAPDRQSVRVMAKNANAAAAAATDATSMDGTSSPAPAHLQNHHMASQFHQNQAYPDARATPAHAPMTFMMQGPPGAHLSTPKTSVLGPKRVACDVCRRRRIKCKHKDIVQQLTPDGVPSVNGIDPALAPELHDNITVSPSKFGENGHMGYQMGANSGPYAGGLPNGDGFSAGGAGRDGPMPGTSAYVTANIPMAMNGVQMFGEVGKKGRSKACYECRKSKRRCIHDESGNVDPAKAAEPPIPRAGIPSKKRAALEDRQRSPLLKKTSSEGSPSYTPISTPHQHHMVGHGVLKPSFLMSRRDCDKADGRASSERDASAPPPRSRSPQSQSEQPQLQPQTQPTPNIDPSLYEMYSTREREESYGEPRNSYSYPNADQGQPYPQGQSGYQMPSLEQIANEVLVDMNGNEQPEHAPSGLLPDGFDQIHAFNQSNAASMLNGLPHAEPEPKPDGSVDSAVSLPANEASQNSTGSASLANGEAAQLEQGTVEGLPNGDVKPNMPPQPSIETEQETVPHQPPSPALARATSPIDAKPNINTLPLYQPPAPPAKSPEVAKKQPNGVQHGGVSMSPPTETPGKRKRDDASVTPSVKGAKKAKVGEVVEGDDGSAELVRMLQQEDRGLRRRSK
ncbi:JmjC domain-containing histone demethylation protein 1 [Saxophila tyrrhenica]|uniref:JmjC domain-containing histone demethylation protein 1 n=1 Tax=Saxophila tyrrhenica TaxID=1690608 RepID=A0AAV9P6Z5_9PEZI|nr:JmjC domain-containing histone demethylation protein 1 [Saxophila tyrrhenica]